MLGNVGSNWAKVISGPSQVSALGPLLFVVYVNDLTDHGTNMMKWYADYFK